MYVIEIISKFVDTAENLLYNNITHRNLEYELINEYNNIYSNLVEIYFMSDSPSTIEILLIKLRVILFKCINKINWLKLNDQQSSVI